jgi:hypothetical protein
MPLRGLIALLVVPGDVLPWKYRVIMELRFEVLTRTGPLLLKRKL